MENKIEPSYNLNNLMNISTKDAYLKNEVSRLVKENTSLRVRKKINKIK